MATLKTCSHCGADLVREGLIELRGYDVTMEDDGTIPFEQGKLADMDSRYACCKCGTILPHRNDYTVEAARITYTHKGATGNMLPNAV